MSCRFLMKKNYQLISRIKNINSTKVAQIKKSIHYLYKEKTEILKQSNNKNLKPIVTIGKQIKTTKKAKTIKWLPTYPIGSPHFSITQSTSLQKLKLTTFHLMLLTSSSRIKNNKFKSHNSP